MLTAKCMSCGGTNPVREMECVNEQVYCKPCAEEAIRHLQDSNAPVTVLRIIDLSICGNCGSDGGSTAYNSVGGIPMCPVCTEKAYNYGYPAWLKLGLAGALMLLLFALYHGTPYFRIGIKLAHSEKLLVKNQFKAAIPELTEVVRGAPQCEKCILLLASAHFRAGHPRAATTLLTQHNQGKFEDSELQSQVERQYNSAVKSNRFMQTAFEQSKVDLDKALASVRNAHSAYPEWKVPVLYQDNILLAKACRESKFDAAVSEAEKIDARDKTPASAMQLAAMLAFRYVATGDATFKQSSEVQMKRAYQMVRESRDGRIAYDNSSTKINYMMSVKTLINPIDEIDRLRQVTSPEVE